MLKAISDLFSDKKYIIKLVDDLVAFLRSRGVSDGFIKEFELCETYINGKYSVTGSRSVRFDVMRRDLLEKVKKHDFEAGGGLGVEGFVLIIISVERFGLHVSKSTSDLVLDRLARHGIYR
jgi:hypothetical protein